MKRFPHLLVAVSLALGLAQMGDARAEQATVRDYHPEVKFLYRDETGKAVNLRDFGLYSDPQRTDLNSFETSVEEWTKASPQFGLAGAATGLAQEEILEGKGEHSPLQWKRVSFVLNPGHGKGIFDVSVRRLDKDGKETSKRWVVAVDSGLSILPMDMPNHNNPQQRFKYKVQARGDDIRMIAYLENGTLITDGDHPVYTSSAESCIDVFSVEEPVDSGTLVYDSAFDGPRDTTGMCFGRCAQPGIVATNGG